MKLFNEPRKRELILTIIKGTRSRKGQQRKKNADENCKPGCRGGVMLPHVTEEQEMKKFLREKKNTIRVILRKQYESFKSHRYKK